MSSLLLLASLAAAAVPATAGPLAPFQLDAHPLELYVLAPHDAPLSTHPAERGFVADDAPLASPVPGTSSSVSVEDVYAKKYLRHLQLADTGLITLGVGAGVTTLGVVVVVAGAVQGNEGTLLLGTGGMVIGVLGSYVGQVLFSIGGLEAAYDLRHLGRNGPVVMGWVTCGMMAGAAVATFGDTLLTVSGAQTTEATELSALSTVSTVLLVGSLVPGLITYVGDRREGVDLRASFVPTVVPVFSADGGVHTVPALGVVGTW